ncbi:hypothetical protein BURK1_01739 [Burkholderiales bacterium]|nr:hypothetical protein BURK1_01739 [Burkholderiales bacterium]
MNDIGILAYGSLINDPGIEIEPQIARRISALTPFPVEYARFSQKRGGAPTVVPHPSGSEVTAVVLVLSELVLLDEAKSLLWRRETHQMGTGRAYREVASENAVLIRDQRGFCGINHVLYTDFNMSGKINQPNPRLLAEAAVASVAKASHGSDGISYLLNLIEAGVETALTADYVRSILAVTGAATLEEARNLSAARV